jgi:hypothetical protein
MGWLSVLDMTQVKDVEAIWHRLNVEHQFVSYETRLLLAQSKEEPPWIMCNAYPEVNAETGAVESIVSMIVGSSYRAPANLNTGWFFHGYHAFEKG